MVAAKYQETKEKGKAEMQKVVAVSLTSDMWTSINMDAYLAVTCHFIDDHDKLGTVLLGVEKFPNSHTAANIAQVKTTLMLEWGITDKVGCLVTDAAPNMIACARNLKIRHAVCIAHNLNLIVRKSFEHTPGLNDMRTKSRKIVAYFRTSTTAKERLTQVQERMGGPSLKMIQEVDTRWNSTFHMLDRLYQQREPVGAALASLNTDLTPLTSQEYEAIGECLRVLSPFQQATVELSEEKRVSGSKVIPLMNMLQRAVDSEGTNMTTSMAGKLAENLVRRLRDTLSNLESLSVMTMATMLDPRFRTHGFFSQSKASEAVTRLKAECATVIRTTAVTPSPSDAPSPPPQPAQAAGPATTSGPALISMVLQLSCEWRWRYPWSCNSQIAGMAGVLTGHFMITLPYIYIQT
ncbi:hypothetical protein SKAU_G00135680 [Synaphobranchus kaupii]|uniref:Zinc finger BED domain-containing protein 4 n=1 Tax=Synaphobranchus kaupii TaxID=118154 RepID=A0A9Q1FSA6_SYNKA|nr:hypothetical protein SKAU_G00135680 [Synaphobranchus kaupii]